MRLFFLRHADADVGSHGSDSERALSPSGIDDVVAVANALRLMKLTFTVVLSSPLKRARQTAEIATKQFPSIKIQTLEHLLSTSDPENLFRELQSFPRDSRALLVSHEPFVSRCIANLICVGSEPKISIKKAALSCVEVGSPVQRGAGVLLWLLTNEQMRLMKS